MYSIRNFLNIRKCGKFHAVRLLSSTEVSTALRPFYFLVHPDLFGKYPKEQAENEKSLKTLKNYVDTMANEKKKPNPKDVQFYVKPRTLQQKERNILLSLKIRLVDTRLRETVLTILKAAELPTGYVDAIPEKKVESTDKAKEIFTDPLEEDEPQGHQTSSFSSTDKRQPLLGWLQNNMSVARQRLSRHEPIRLETERLQVRGSTVVRMINNIPLNREKSATSMSLRISFGIVGGRLCTGEGWWRHSMPWSCNIQRYRRS